MNREVLRSGLTELMREKYYQYCFLEILSDPDRDEISEEVLKREIASLTDPKKPEYPMMPGEGGNLEAGWDGARHYLNYLLIYDREGIQHYLDVQTANEQTMKNWFMNISGCSWICSGIYEEDEYGSAIGYAPEGHRFSSKMDNFAPRLDEDD